MSLWKVLLLKIDTYRTRSTSHSSSHSAEALSENSSQFGFVTLFFLDRKFRRGELKDEEAMADPTTKAGHGFCLKT